jgi:hypothetical protein
VAFQTPAYSFLHAAAAAGVGNLSSRVAPASGYPLDNLIDYKPSTLFRHGGTTALEWVVIDRGTQPMGEGVDHMMIPVGHNLGTCSLCRIWHSTDGIDWGTALTGWNQQNESDPDGFIDRSFTLTTNRYLRFSCQESGTAWEFGQLVFTRKRTPTAILVPGWDRPPQTNTISVPFPTRTASLSLAPDRLFYDFKYRRVDGADLTFFDELYSAVGLNVPFYFYPPDDALDPLYMKISERREFRQDRPNPAGPLGPAYQIGLSLLEQTA